MCSRNAENELDDERRNVEAGVNNHPRVNSDLRPAIEGEEAVVEKK